MQSISLERIGIGRFLQTRFNSKIATLVCFATAWINKSLISVFFTSLQGDKSLYLLFSKSILNGHLPLEPVKLIGSESSQYFFNPGITTPLYSILALPFLWLTNSFYLTSVILDIVAWGILLSGLFYTSRLIFKERWISNVLILCSGFFLFPHELGSGPKDGFGVGLILWGIYFTNQFISKKPGSGTSILLLIIYTGIAFSKLLYLPVSLLLVCILNFYSFKNGNKVSRRHSIFIGLGLIFILFAGFYFLNQLKQYRATDVAGHYLWGGAGFFLSNLLNTYPFISSSLVNTNFWGVQLSDILHVRYITIIRGFQLLDIFLIAISFFSLKHFLRVSSSEKKIFSIFLLLSLVILFTLGYMSVRHESILFARENSWTYVQEARSFLLIMLLLQIVLFYLLFQSNWINTGLRNFIFLLFFIECVHGFYFTVKTAATNPEQKGDNTEKLISFYKDLRKKSIAPVVLITTDEYLRRYAMVSGIDVQAFYKDAHPSNSNSQTIYLSVTFDSDSSLLRQQFISNKIVLIDSSKPFMVHIIN